MKRSLAILLLAVTPVLILFIHSTAEQHSVRAQSGDGPLYSAREKLMLTRDKATGQVSGSLEKGRIAVAYVNLWSRQSIERASTLYTPVATITEVQPVILFSHCDLPYKFELQQGRLVVSGQCTQPNWSDTSIDVVVLYSK